MASSLHYSAACCSLATVVALFLQAGCNAGCMDADPFRLSYRRIAGEYELYQSEGDLYYLARDRYDSYGVGYIEGTVQELGWTRHHIFAKRYSCFRGDPDGWIIIDLHTNLMSGPYTDEEFRLRFPDAVVYAAERAWERL